MDCEHNYQYQGTVYWFGYQLAGSSAHERILGDRYFCTKCLNTVIKNERIDGTSYSPRIAGVLPR